MQSLPTLSQLPESLNRRVTQQLTALHESATAALNATLEIPEIQASLPLVWASSEFVMNACVRHTSLLPSLVNQASLLSQIDAVKLRELLDQSIAAATDDTEFQSHLRHFRQLHMARIA